MRVNLMGPGSVRVNLMGGPGSLRVNLIVGLAGGKVQNIDFALLPFPPSVACTTLQLKRMQWNDVTTD